MAETIRLLLMRVAAKQHEPHVQHEQQTNGFTENISPVENRLTRTAHENRFVAQAQTTPVLGVTRLASCKAGEKTSCAVGQGFSGAS